MFKMRAYLINSYLVSLDLTITGACYLAVCWGELPPGGRLTRWRALLDTEHAFALGCILGVWLASLFYFQVYRSKTNP